MSALVFMSALVVTPALAQGGRGRGGRGGPPPAPTLPDLPLVFETASETIRVSLVTRGLAHPWSLAFLPDGDMLVTERDGRLRIIRNGVLAPDPITGVPEVRTGFLAGLMEVALHPNFIENQLVYLTYSKPGPDETATTALLRARFDGRALVGAEDIFVADAWNNRNTNFGSRIAFGPDGMLYMTIGDRGEADRAQKTDDHVGKILRLRDDGTAPDDNPFVGRPGYKPEIYSMGHRSPQGLAFNPADGTLWSNEHGPQGGDEVNVIRAGANYGWPLVTYGIDYSGDKLSESPWRPDLEDPLLYWVPSIAVSGLTFYKGDRFPSWKGSVLVGGMVEARTRGTGQVQRLIFNDEWEPIRREAMLRELKQRIRDVREGPDGLLYVLTEEADGALLRIEPAE
jgi:glucose/arabinose dehydrogenase